MPLARCGSTQVCVTVSSIAVVRAFRSSLLGVQSCRKMITAICVITCWATRRLRPQRAVERWHVVTPDCSNSNSGGIKMAAEANLSLFRQHAAVILAQQAAQQAIKRQIKREGRVKLSSLTAAHIARLAIEYLDQHPQLIAQAAASPIVQNLKAANGMKGASTAIKRPRPKSGPPV